MIITCLHQISLQDAPLRAEEYYAYFGHSYEHRHQRTVDKLEQL